MVIAVVLTIIGTILVQKGYSAACQWWRARCAREVIWVTRTGQRAHLKPNCESMNNAKSEKIYIHPRVNDLLMWCRTCNPVMATRYEKSGSSSTLTQRRLARLEENSISEEGQSTTTRGS